MIAWVSTGAASGKSAPPTAPFEPTTVTYETTACFGYCPVYRLTVNADGTGVLATEAHTVFKGIRRFRVTPQQYQSFLRELAPVRPRDAADRYDFQSRCGPGITDMPTVVVKWRGRRGRLQTLFFYLGCPRDRFGWIADRLERAPTLLPIAALIQSDRPVRAR